MPKKDGSVTIVVDVDGKQVNVKLSDIQDQLDALHEKEEAASASAEAGMAVMAAGAAAAGAALIAATKAAVDYSTAFDSAFAKTETIMDENVMSAEAMRDDVLELSKDAAMAATDVSEAVYQAISGSVATADAVGFVDKANRLAVAGFTDLSAATDILTTTLNAYQLSADKTTGISNVLIMTQNLGKTSVDELSKSMGKVISTGSAYNVNLQNIATGYVELTRGGIATAEATTYLSGMLNELGNSGSAVGKIIQDETGKSFGQLMSDGASLGDVLTILSDSVNGNAEAMMGLWSSQEAGKAANAIMVQGIEDFNSVCKQMNEELSGTTGTTESAYATMTSTAEFIDRRLKNSIANLGIAYGSQLMPPLNSIKSLFADWADDLTEYVKRNPEAVAATTGLAAGLATLAAGYAALLVAKKAAAAVQALNAAMESNPYILAATAIAAVVVAVGTMATTMIEDAKAAYEQNVEAAREYTETLGEQKAALEDNIATIDASASVADRYIDRLEELEATGLTTQEQQEEYHNLLVLLTQTVPELADSINLETNAIEGGTAALRVQTAAWQENAKAQAMQQYLTDTYASYSAILVEAEKNQIRLTAAENEKKAALEQLIPLQNAENAAMKAANEAATKGGTELAALNEQFEYLPDSYYETEVEIANLKSVIFDCDKEIETINKQIAEGEEAAAAARTEIETTEEAIKNLTGAVEEGTAATGEATAAGETNASLMISWADAAHELQDAYDEEYATAYDNITKQIGLFQQMDVQAATSASALISALDSQIAYMDTYAANMQRAAEMGVSEGLLKQLNDGSAQSAQILAGMVTMTDEQVQEMNTKFAKVEEGKQGFADAMAEYSGVLTDEKENMLKAAEEAGAGVSDKLSTEARNGLPTFQAVMDQYLAAIRTVQSTASAITQGTSAGTIYLPHYAGGTYNAEAGYALVGEYGPELVLLHGGERILTAEETSAAMHSLYPEIPGIGMMASTPPAISGRGAGRTETLIIVPVQIDGREVARQTAVYMGEEMEFGVM